MKFGSDTCNPFITLACDFRCPYCITKATPGWNFGYPHRECAEWAEALNNLEDVTHIVLNGGEPTLRPGFADMIAAIAPSDAKWPNDWKIALGCNGTERARKVLLGTAPRPDFIIDLSFHPSDITLPEIMETAMQLKAAGHNVRAHTISWPGLGVAADWFARQLTNAGIVAFVQNYDGWWHDEPRGVLDTYPGEQPACDLTKPPRRARCHRTIYTPIAPNGDVYFCHAAMYERADWGVIGNVFDGWISDAQVLECQNYGRCNPCDRPRETEVLE